MGEMEKSFCSITAWLPVKERAGCADNALHGCFLRSAQVFANLPMQEAA